MPEPDPYWGRPTAELPRGRWQEAFDIVFILAAVALIGLVRVHRARQHATERTSGRGLPSFPDQP